MSKFIYLYKGPAMTEKMSAEQGAAWEAWMGKLGTALVDVGAPFGGGTVVVDDGSTAKVSNSNGYSVVEAADIKSAVALSEGNPLLLRNTGQYSIEIFELIEM